MSRIDLKTALNALHTSRLRLETPRTEHGAVSLTAWPLDGGLDQYRLGLATARHRPGAALL